MEIQALPSKLSVLLLAAWPQYLGASAAPILVGSALGYAVTGRFDFGLFLLALFAIMALHAGANVVNDYFDSQSGDDWVNENPTPFSGGRQLIQQGILSPKATPLAGLAYLGLGAALDLVIVVLSGKHLHPRELASPGCSGRFSIPPALIVAILIFLVILVNEFPDLPADRQVDKRTMIVVFGIPACVLVYRATMIASYVLATLMPLNRMTSLAGMLCVLTLPLAVAAMRAANEKNLVRPGLYRVNQLTIFLHNLGTVMVAAGLLSPALIG
jgi:1,4-dihydroxy-2-naphthoate octaprenyltransferase